MAEALEVDFVVENTIEIDIASYDEVDGVFTDASIENLEEPIVIETIVEDSNYSVKVVTEEGFEDVDSVTITQNSDNTYTVTAETSHLSMFVLVSGDNLRSNSIQTLSLVTALLI